jgi:hypothetical protein
LHATLEWLGPDEQAMAAELAAAGILKLTWAALHRQYVEWMGSVSESSGLAFGVEKENGAYRTTAEIDYSNWQPHDRRCAKPGLPAAVDEQILYHLRGSKNAEFKLGEAA